MKSMDSSGGYSGRFWLALVLGIVGVVGVLAVAGGGALMIAPLLYVVIVGVVVVAGFLLLLRSAASRHEARPRRPALPPDESAVSGIDALIEAGRQPPIVGWGFTTAEARRTVRQEEVRP